MKNYKLNLFETFNSMRIFLRDYWNKTDDEDIALILSGMQLVKDRIDWKENPETWDPPAWSDWMNGVNQTLKDLKVNTNPKRVIFNEETAFLCMKNYLQLFYNQFPFEGVKNILIIINKINPEEMNTHLWLHWLSCIKYATEKPYDLDI